MKDIPELTGIRFFAAFVVCAYHFSPGFGMTSISTALQAPAMSAVSLFFILSGFILSYSYLPRLSTTKLWYFFWARFARLAPAFITVMIAMIPIRLLFLMSSPEAAKIAYGLSLDSPILVLSWLANLSLVAVFIPMLNPWLYFWNPPAWSLTAEVIFYMGFPFVITLFNRIKRESFLFWTAVTLYGLLCLIIVSAFLIIMNMPLNLFPLWYTSSLKLGATSINEMEVRSYSLTYFVYLLPFLRCFEFWIGCSSGCLFVKLKENDNLPQKTIRNCLLALSILLMCIGYQVNNLTMGGMGTGIYAVYTPGFTLFIFSLASGKTFASGLLSHKWIVILGKSSYALYISHYAGMATYQGLANIKGLVFPQGSYFIAVGLCLAISLIIYYLVEIPVQRWLIEIGKSRLASS